jgi:glycosyltransferase involved in cell wall biosynthesis
MLIGTDRALFAPGSAVRERIARFATEHTDALDSIVFAKRTHGVEAQKFGQNAHAYPTNSRSRLLYGWDALRIARHLPRPDAVSAQDPFETGLAAYFIARYFKVPLMVEMHTDFVAPSFARHSWLNRARVIIAGFVLRRASGGYAVSEKIKTAVLKRYDLAAPIDVLPIYVDTSRFDSLTHVPHPRFKVALLWVGRMEEEKNPMLALRALVAARQQKFDIGLTFVGDGSLMKSLKTEARESGVEEWVEFAGHVPDVSPYYAHADLLLVTSTYEGYGMAIVEALAAGVPVLSRDVGIAREAGATIAQGSYTKALVAWLKGPHERGKLKLRPYANEEDYFARVAALYKSAV